LGEGAIIFWFAHELISPSPTQPSVIKGEGVLAILHAPLKLGMIVLGAKAIIVINYSGKNYSTA